MAPPNSSPSSEAPSPEALRLALLLAARMAHDLGSPLGTLAGMLDMLDGGDPELLAVAQQASGDLRARLSLYRAAWGTGAEPADAAGLQALLAGSAAAQRVAFEFAGPLFQAVVPGELVPLVLNGALVAAEALPRGGRVVISGDRADLVFIPEGRNAAWPAEVATALSGRPEPALEAGPRRVVAPLLLALAAAQRFEVSLMPGMGPALPALLLTRR